MKKSKVTEALRVTSEIAAIRVGLKKHGYRIHKCPKQPAWRIYVTDARGGSPRPYLLIYQPAPISAWVLHPHNNDSLRQTLENIIQRAITRRARTLPRPASLT